MSRVFGNNLKAIRERRRMTQADFARYLGLSTSAYSMYERGEREPSFENLCAIGNALGVSITELVSESKDDRPNDQQTELIALFNHAESDLIRQIVLEILRAHQVSERR